MACASSLDLTSAVTAMSKQPHDILLFWKEGMSFSRSLHRRVSWLTLMRQKISSCRPISTRWHLTTTQIFSTRNFISRQWYHPSQLFCLYYNLGFIFDSDMSFTDQINSLSESCHFHIRDIRRIRHLLPLSAATALANSLVWVVSSEIDQNWSLQ